MYWQEDDDKPFPPAVPDDVVDVTFKVACRALPLDHAHALSEALLAALPWLREEPQAAVHLIHGAESGNGWLRPEDPDALLYPSRRTRFTLRVPKHRVADARALAGRTLDVGGHAVTLRDPHVRELSPLTTVFSRHVMSEQDEEAAFLEAVARRLREELDIRVRKMVAGREHTHRFPDREIRTRSLMIDGLRVEESIRLQQRGLGPGRLQGFGIFLPHKAVGGGRGESGK
jgi:CRISPR-associated protein Cas6